ncbi:putative reverse transcriptase domain-containing protein [Tanacetum coccineum]
MINGNGIHVDPNKIEAIKNWKALRTPIEGEEHELAFQTLKDKLCNVHVLALPDGPKDLVVYCDSSEIGLGYVLMHRGKRRWIELFNDYDCEIHYHPGKANVVADALTQKEVVDESVGLQKGLDEMIELRSDGTLYYLDQIWVPLKGDVRTLIMDEAYKSKYSVHPGADKMYYDLRDRYWWPRMKKDIAEYIKDRLKAARDHQKSYADKRRKPLEFTVVEYVLLKVSPWKGIVRFGKKRKLAPRFVGPFNIIEKAGLVAYRLDLPGELNGVHDTFHMSNLKKCLTDPTLQVPLDEIRFDDKLNFVEEPMKILEREFKKLKRSRIAIVKVRWNSKRGPEFMWERED